MDTGSGARCKLAPPLRSGPGAPALRLLGVRHCVASSCVPSDNTTVRDRLHTGKSVCGDTRTLLGWSGGECGDIYWSGLSTPPRKATGAARTRFASLSTHKYIATTSPEPLSGFYSCPLRARPALLPLLSYLCVCYKSSHLLSCAVAR